MYKGYLDSNNIENLCIQFWELSSIETTHIQWIQNIVISQKLRILVININNYEDVILALGESNFLLILILLVVLWYLRCFDFTLIDFLFFEALILLFHLYKMLNRELWYLWVVSLWHNCTALPVTSTLLNESHLLIILLPSLLERRGACVEGLSSQ